jgi:hypothetical protein
LINESDTVIAGGNLKSLKRQVRAEQWHFMLVHKRTPMVIITSGENE